VTTETLAGPNWIVTAGLADGDRVIFSGTQNARPGSTVAAVSAAAAPADTSQAAADVTASAGTSAH
jgi:hypothetical protein